MAIRRIVTDADGFLRKKSKHVDKIDARTLKLIDDMRDTLAKHNGVGLAAVQVGILKRIFIVNTGDETIELINPEILSAEGEQEDLEGCLSIPGKWGITHRPMKVTVRAEDRNGEVKTYSGEGLVARAFCHENDHLDGKLYIDIATSMLTQEEVDALD
ncbi:MAG: peptide deformylase [Oscillospiraceae bacterium]|nr:peptide deformylase [Oscillospiraceae bacterium]